MRPKHLHLTETDDYLRAAFRDLRPRQDVATLLKVSDKELIYLLFRKNAPRYRQFSLRKRDGGARVISAPEGSLKIVQQKLNQVLQAVYRPKAPVHGFARDRSIVSNAAPHADRRWVLNLDLENFFPSIHFGRVMGMFAGKTYGLPRPAAMTLAQICCYQKAMPQGAPTSPVVSNMVCGPLDIQLRKLAAAHNCNYTRYADDITFSTDRPQFPAALASVTDDAVKIGDDLRRVIEANSFRIHEAKVRLRTRGERQEVTGLIANAFPNVTRQFVRRVRGMLHAWKTFGEAAAHAEFVNKHDRKQRRPEGQQPRFRDVLLGRLAFIRMVKGPTDPLYVRLWHRLAALAPDTYAPIREVHNIDDVPSALWILESDAAGAQGSGFVLERYGLVTCDHCVHPDTVAFRANDPLTRYAVRVRQRSDVLDLAIVEIEHGTPLGGILRAGNSVAMKPGDSIELFGFPNYAKGQEASRTSTTVSGRAAREGTQMLIVAAPTFAGISGGPATDSAGNVIGVIKTGFDGHDAVPGRIIDIAELGKLLPPTF